jgi:glycosyltransferase involved in cell wall biosynthesis
MNRHKVLIFFPHNPFPPKTGAHKRCLEFIAALNDIGCEVHFCSSTYTSDSSWENFDIEYAYQIKDSLNIYHAKIHERISQLIARAFYRIIRSNIPFHSTVYCTNGMKKWFSNIQDEVNPNIIVINYVYWDSILGDRRDQSKIYVMETIDIVSINTKMRRVLSQFLPKNKNNSWKINELCDEDFFEKRNIIPEIDEFDIYDKYDFTIAISEKEAKIINKSTKKTNLIWIPMTQEVIDIDNDYSGPALYPTGPNPFNLQGYYYFSTRVLPKILEQAPDFTLRMTGTCCPNVITSEKIKNLGFVNDLEELYKCSRFVIAPLIGGTGQQVKIIEAMAHGLPVIALKNIAESSPIIHGENGYIASDADEFAQYVLKLWGDPNLCKILGEKAKETIRKDFSSSRIRTELQKIVYRHFNK